MGFNEMFSPEEMEILRIRAAVVAAPLQQEGKAGHVTALITTTKHERYALPIDALTAVYQDVFIVPLPCVPDYIAGIANMRGHIISVLDLGALLGVRSNGEALGGAMIVVGAGGASIGFRVDAIGEVIELSLSQMTQTPTNTNLTSSAGIRGIFPDGTALLNMSAILDDPRLSMDERNVS